jgi:hypothetical protein
LRLLSVGALRIVVPLGSSRRSAMSQKVVRAWDQDPAGEEAGDNHDDYREQQQASRAAAFGAAITPPS